MMAYVARYYVHLILRIYRMTRDLIAYENWFAIQNLPSPASVRRNRQPLAAFGINRRRLAGSFARAVAVPRFPSAE